MFTDTDKFNMSITHIVHISRQFICQLTVIQKAILIQAIILFPGPQMDFINCHRSKVRIIILSAIHIILVCPFITIQICNYRIVCRPQFRCECKGISLITFFPVSTKNHIFISVTSFGSRDKQFPNPVQAGFHNTFLFIPIIC